MPFAIRGLAPGASTASTATAQLSADAEPPLAALLRQGARRASGPGAAHIETLERNIEQLRRTRSADPAGLGATRGAVRAGDGPRTGAAAQLGTVGAITTVRVPNLDAGDICVANFPIGVRTVVTTAHAIIVEDTASIAGGRTTLRGQMDEYFVRLGDEFERVMWPILSASFGNPLAMDAALGGPGKVVMVFSPRVNALQRGNVTAFVASCDFFPTASRPSSNQGAFFYAYVPTSPAAGYSDPETRDQWMRLIRGTVIHEVKHIVSFAERYSRNLPVEDVSWEEGSARVAEEMFARSIYGTLPRANTRYAPTLGCDIRYLTVTPGCSDRPMLMLRHFDGLYAYASAPEIYSPLGRTFGGDVAMYGGAWSFLRWAADHFVGPEAQFFREHTTGSGTGASNLEARTGRTWDEMLGEWSLALFLDDLAAFNPLNPRLRLLSWDLNDVWNGLCTDLGPCVDPLNPTQVYSRSPPFFPRARAFGNFLIGVGTLVTGGFTLLDLTGGPLPSQIVELKALTTNADPPAVLRLTISRVR
ncbi:MAG: hypothetical protein FJ202_13385 [Gemmatimonadetes bacterium]|nr:hypothetical protein [Gemmatimonadota bacterium]